MVIGIFRPSHWPKLPLLLLRRESYWWTTSTFYVDEPRHVLRQDHVSFPQNTKPHWKNEWTAFVHTRNLLPEKNKNKTLEVEKSPGLWIDPPFEQKQTNKQTHIQTNKQTKCAKCEKCEKLLACYSFQGTGGAVILVKDVHVHVHLSKGSLTHDHLRITFSSLWLKM